MFNSSTEFFSTIKIIAVVLLAIIVTVTVLDVNTSVLASLNFRNQPSILEGMTTEEKDRKILDEAVKVINEEIMRVESKGGKINGNNIETFKNFIDSYKEYSAKTLVLKLVGIKNSSKEGALNADALSSFRGEMTSYNQMMQGLEHLEKDLDTGRFDR